MSTGFLLAYEKKKGRASHFWPYMCLLPQTPQCLWWQPSNEAAGLAEIAQRAGILPLAPACAALEAHAKQPCRPGAALHSWPWLACCA